MFAEVVSQVAALAEDGHAPRVLAAVVLLRALAVITVYLDYVVPLLRNPLEVLHDCRLYGSI